MDLSAKKAWEVVCTSFNTICDSLGKYPPAPHGGAIMNFHIPASKPSEPAKPVEPKTVTLANGMVVPAPKEGVNVYDPRKDEGYDCAEVSLYEPPVQHKVAVPRMTEEQAARWCL